MAREDLVIPGGNQHHSPALLYHKVTRAREFGVTWVTPGIFQQQILKLTAAGWQTANPDSSDVHQVPPSHTFHLAFDDGYENVYLQAYPVLSEHNLKPLVFIPTSFIGQENTWDHNVFSQKFRHLDRPQIIELHRAGWEFGSHGLTHRDLTTVGHTELIRELRESRQILEDLTGAAVNWISYPFGRYNENLLQLSLAAGYSGAVVPVRRKALPPDGFRLIVADAVYCWNTAASVLRILERSHGYRRGRALRNLANRLNAGTLYWKKIFHG